MVHLVLFLVHGVDSGSGPELQQRLEQQSSQVHYRDEGAHKQWCYHVLPLFNRNLHMKWDYILHFGSDPSELENPASLADTQAAKQSLSSSVMVSIW